MDPTQCHYLNLFADDTDTWEPDPVVLRRLRLWTSSGRRSRRVQVVALGRRVQHALRRADVPHIPLIHPAARGAIRAKPVYQQHERDALAETLRT
jgi:hypothetical protein